MKAKIDYTHKRGLPGGPNEQFTYVTGIFSVNGYRDDSPDVNNPFNVIPSGRISMREHDGTPLKKGPILGIDNLGNKKMMQPGKEYQFPGEYVTEIPQMQFGGMSKRKVDKILNANKDLNFVQRLYQENTPSIMIPGQTSPSTHFMESADGKVYPTVVQMPDGTLQYLGDKAYEYAMETGEYIQFPNDRQATRFGKSYKKGTGVLQEFAEGGTSCPQGMYWDGKRCVPYYNMDNRNTTDNTRVAAPIVPPGYRPVQNAPKVNAPAVPKKVYVAPADNSRIVRPNTQIVADNTRVVLPPPPPQVPAGPPRHAQATISQYNPPSTFDYLLNKAANPMTTIGYVVRGQDIPDMVRPKDNAFDYAMDIVNPFAWVDYGLKAIEDYGEGNIIDGTLNALGAVPALGPAKNAARAAKPFVKPAIQKTLRPVFNAALDMKYGVNTPAVQFERQMGRVADIGDIRTVREVSTKASQNNPTGFVKKIASGADEFDNVIKSRVEDLSTPEGMSRLRQQEKEYLESIGFGKDHGEEALLKQARQNALARYSELKNITSVNREASNLLKNNYITPENAAEFTGNNLLHNNAYFRKSPLVGVFDNYIAPGEVQEISNGFNITKIPQLGGTSLEGGKLAIGAPHVGNIPVMHHEIGHALQRGRKMPIDRELQKLSPDLQNLNKTSKQAYDYFMTGSKGQEPTAFANELRSSMQQRGLIQNIYDPITPELLQEAYTSFRNKPMGIFTENASKNLRGDFLTTHRIMDFIKPTPRNFEILSGAMNKLPAALPIGVGLGAGATLTQEANGGSLKAQDGNEITEQDNFLKNWFTNRQMPTQEGQKLLEKVRPEAIERASQNVPYVMTDQLPKDVAGYYDTEDKNIYLNKTYTPEQINSTKEHERVHYVQDGDKFYKVLDTPHRNLVEQNIREPKEINTGNPEWDKNVKENYDDIVAQEEMHARIMTLRRLAGFKPDQVITEEMLNNYFNSVKESGKALDPDIEDLKAVTKGNSSIVNLLNDMVSVPQKKDTVSYAQEGGELDLYKKYINGDFDGSPEELKAKKVYDKLNRVYYKPAKEAGMSVPNYIMSNVLTL